MNLFRSIYVYIKRKNRVYSKNKIVVVEKEQLKNTEFVIVADDCWGAAVYQWYGRSYNSPFAGVGIYGDCFIKLLSDFDEYMKKELKFVTETKYPQRPLNYPMALLGDVELHFTHYKTKEDAGTKWERRTQRMLEVTDKDNYFFKMSDVWGASEENYEAFHKLPFKNKVSYIPKNKKDHKLENQVGIVEPHKVYKTTVPNGVKLFKISFLYFDLTEWLLNKKVVRTRFKS
ncbi:MAG: hypothetical protein BM563_05830 [Bacteroidetes bacterium MedPE-SWsnd-G1]|uniref:DUF1919 domain-containing protein n=1 Tax=Urechidicola vernalis TaxID=3075600 RepID=A0ABU2Y6L2_9FLAO|nr:DUF1919 domain-containing protein [Urechidicola sp. P050]MDT0553833.1 DUF1919 domain-containing protein [Urechidicola sp. P050]OIQ38552.1 MAG: hypothetical protein BM563_05830 [Bacteroidetes bacterium MedPE-SWsnd-G1]